MILNKILSPMKNTGIGNSILSRQVPGIETIQNVKMLAQK